MPGQIHYAAMINGTWLWDRLREERKVIRGAKIHFTGACLIIAIISGVLWYAVFSTIFSLQSSTIEAYKNIHDPSLSMQ